MPEFKGQFHEIKLSVNSYEVEQNLLVGRKTKGKGTVKVLKIPPGGILFSTFVS